MFPKLLVNLISNDSKIFGSVKVLVKAFHSNKLAPNSKTTDKTMTVNNFGHREYYQMLNN